MATISSPGIGSGLDITSIVSKLVALEQQPITQLQTQASTMQTQLSSFGTLQSLMSTVRDAANKLVSPDTWSATTGSSSDSNTVSVITGTDSPPGSYSVSVQSLASAQTVSQTTAVASSSTAFGQGSLTIQLGTYSADSSSFTPKSNTPAITVTIGSGQDTLAGIRDQINAAGAGVTASIVNDATGARLALRSTATGKDNGFTISATDSNGGSLSQLAFNASSPSSTMSRTVSAANAAATINGLAISSASNTLTGVLDGLTLTLGKVTVSGTPPVDAPVNVAVNANSDSIKKAITDFATAYNAFNSNVRDMTKYDAASKKGGVLQGDRTAVNLQTQLRNMLGGSTTASAVFQRLSDVGLDPQSDGSLKVNDSKLSSAVGNLPELRKFFSASSLTDGDQTTTGFAQRMKIFGDAVLGSDGSIMTREASIQASITKNSKDQATAQERVDAYQTRITAQYSALDTQMASLTALSTYMTNQIAAWNK